MVLEGSRIGISATLRAVIVGAVFFVGTGAPAHADIFIQSPDGGGCTLVGTWDDGSATCTLTQDVSERVVISLSPFVTLDGANHLIDVSSSFGGDGILVSQSAGVNIRNARVQGAGTGIHVDRSDAVVVASSSVRSSAIGVNVFNSTAVEIASNTFGSVDGDPLSVGISTQSASHLSVHENHIVNANSGIVLNGAGSSSVASTTIENAYKGIDIRNTNDASIRDNVVTNSGNAALLIDSESSLRNVVQGNTFEGNSIGARITAPSGGGGVVFSVASWPRFKSGMFAVLRSILFPAVFAQSADDNIFFNNAFLGNAVQAQVDSGALAQFFRLPPDGGNRWSDFDEQSEGCTDADHDGFCDASYLVGPGSGFTDQYPRVQPAAVPATLTPVIIIPGILGSARHDDGPWLIDPITHTYDNLIDTLVANGYEKDKTLFTFPYDWHLSNVTTATLLKNKIDEVKGICLSLGNSPCDKVDIVAHSMGGLVARQYVQSSDYAHDIGKLIFLGTPQMGAPEAYLMWEGGETDIDEIGQELKYFLLIETIKHHYLNIFDYIRSVPIPSVQELLPVYGYIEHVGSADIPSFPNSQWYPGNLFLYDLDNNIANLYNSGVDVTNFVGQTPADKTITTISVVPPAVPSATSIWGFGKPEHFGDTSTDQGLERGAGDGTVPLSSADLVISGLNIIDSEHNDLPTKTEGQVFKKLTGQDATTLVNNGIGTAETLKNILIFQILSPADIVVVDPDGLQVGKDFGTGQEINQIPDAFYSGFGSDDEYVTIPNPKDGQYKVLTQGTGVGGAYTIATGVIDDATSSTTFFSGTTLPNLVTEHDVNVDPTNPDETTIIPADQTPPTITFIQPAATTYTHGAMLPIKVTFSDETGVASSSVSFDTTPVAASSTIDLFFQTLGNHTVSAYAEDLVNNATTSAKKIQVIATYPSTQSDINRAFALGWIKSKDVKNILTKMLTQASQLKKSSDRIIVLKLMLETLKLGKSIGVIIPPGYQVLAADINWLINH